MNYLEENVRVLWEDYNLTSSADIRRDVNLVHKELSNPFVIITKSSGHGGVSSLCLHGFSNVQEALQKLVEDMVYCFSPEKGMPAYRIVDGNTRIIGCILQGKAVKIVPSITGVAVLVKDESGEYSMLSGIIDTKTIEVVDNERKEGETVAEIGSEIDGESRGQEVEAGSDDIESENTGC